MLNNSVRLPQSEVSLIKKPTHVACMRIVIVPSEAGRREEPNDEADWKIPVWGFTVESR